MGKYRIKGYDTKWAKLRYTLDSKCFPFYYKYGTGYKLVNVALRLVDVANWGFQLFCVYCAYDYLTR